MANITYVVTIEHTEKGAGFTARTALQNAQRTKGTPVESAKFHGEPTGSCTQIEVVVNDNTLRSYLENTISSSNRMPKGGYSIKSVELRTEGDALDRYKQLQRSNETVRREVTSLREDNARLRQDLSTRTQVASSPLEGLLAYFESTYFTPEIILEDPVDVDFASRIWKAEIENTLVNYINHITGQNFSDEEVEKILSSTFPIPTLENDVFAEYQAAQQELGYLARLKSGDVEIPESVRPELIKILEAKGLSEIVTRYDVLQEEIRNTQAKQETLQRLKTKWGSFSDKIELLSRAGCAVPVIFHYNNNNNNNNNGVDLYFPFRSRYVKTGFFEDLRREITIYFEGERARVEPIESKFVAYRVQSDDDCQGRAQRLIEDIPVTMRIAGFNAITPYQLG